MPMRKRAKKGFTLVEIIVSIGVLAVVSVFVLRMFVQSENTQQKARDMDFAVLEAGSLVEAVKTLQSPDGILALLPAAAAVSDGYTAELRYGKDYAALDATAGDARFTMRIFFHRTEGTDAGALWDIDVEITRNDPYLLESGTPIIYTVWSEKYFPTI